LGLIGATEEIDFGVFSLKNMKSSENTVLFYIVKNHLTQKFGRDCSKNWLERLSPVLAQLQMAALE